MTNAQLLANTTDVDGDILSVSNLSATNGTITDNGDGTWTATEGSGHEGEFISLDGTDPSKFTIDGARVEYFDANTYEISSF